MSCSAYDYKSDLTHWLYVHGIFNNFIHESANTITTLLKAKNIDYVITIDDVLHITAGLPIVTRFDICRDRVTLDTLGDLQADVSAWDYYTEQQSFDGFIQTSDTLLESAINNQ